VFFFPDFVQNQSRLELLRTFGLKIAVLSRATYLVSIGNDINRRASPVASPTISRALLPMTPKADKLPLETEPVVRDNNTIFTLKPGDQTFAVPYSTDNRSKVISRSTIYQLLTLS